MKLRSVIMVGAGVVAFSTIGLMAEDAATVDTGRAPAEIKAGKKKAADQEFTLTGTLTNTELTNAAGVKKSGYMLTQDNGVIARLGPKAAEAAGINLDGYLKAKVTLVGKGREINLQRKRSIRIDEVIKIVKADTAGAVEEKPAATPAAGKTE